MEHEFGISYFLKIFIFENGASSKIDDVLAEDGRLLHVHGWTKIIVSAPIPYWVFGVRLGWDWGLKGWGLVLDNIHESILLNYSLQKLSVNLLNIKVLTGMVLPRSITNLRGKR